MRWPALFAALVLAGCSTDLGPTPADLKAQWDAQNVYPTNYKSDLLAFLRTYLNNPEHIRGAAVAPPTLKTMGPGDRYIACVRYNARDNENHYAGMKTGFAVYLSGRLDHFVDQPGSVKEMCKDAAFAPFPELETLKR